jgi:hypothetical protein
LSGWRCNLSFQEVDVSERAKLVEIKEPKPEVKDDVTDQVNGSSSSTKKVQQALSESLYLKIKGVAT